MIHNRFIPILSVTAGLLLVIGGLLLAGLYINTVVHSVGEADSSLIFWYIPIFFLGIMMSAAGVYFIAIGYRARTNPDLYKLSKNSLAVLLLVFILTITFVWIGEFRADQTRKELQEQHRILSDLMEIENVEFLNLSKDAFSLHTSISGEQTGEYELIVNIFDSQDELYQTSELHQLNTTENEIITEFTFDQIFEACMDANTTNRSYFCVDNAGTSNTELNIKITLKPHTLNNIQLQPADVETSWTTSLILDTMTRNGLVNVESIKER
jgi:hypothetical protein